MKSQKNNIPIFLLHYLEGKCTKEELNTINTWIADDPRNREEVEFYKKIWNTGQETSASVDVETAWKKVVLRAGISQRTSAVEKSRGQHNRTFIIPQQPRYWYVARIAAIVVVCIGIFYVASWYRTSMNMQSLAMKEVTTGKGQRVTVKFADGTSVMLNSMSTIKFPEKFTGSSREVTLTGEGFFEVAHNEKAPFIVHSGDAIVKVLGTGFDVQAWPDENQVAVFVDHGKVSVRSEKNLQDSEVFLTKGQQSIVQKDERPTDAENVNIEEYLSWTKGRLEFRNTNLKSVLRQLERRYDVRFQVNDSLLFQKTLTATIHEESLKEVLHLMSLSLNIHHENRNGIVTLK